MSTPLATSADVEPFSKVAPVRSSRPVWVEDASAAAPESRSTARSTLTVLGPWSDSCTSAVAVTPSEASRAASATIAFARSSTTAASAPARAA